ncbi:MAG: hypothetical protein MUC99_10860 [Anaerolineae bacterium]|nr:hypothetical protein [Anaerolineae bacterium]
MEFMTRDIWEALIAGVLIIGAAFVFLRLYLDFSRPLPADDLDDPTTPPKGTSGS